VASSGVIPACTLTVLVSLRGEHLNQSNRILSNKLPDTVITQANWGLVPPRSPVSSYYGTSKSQPAVPEKQRPGNAARLQSRKPWRFFLLYWIGSHRRTDRGRVRRSRPDLGARRHAITRLLLQKFLCAAVPAWPHARVAPSSCAVPFLAPSPRDKTRVRPHERIKSSAGRVADAG